MAREPSEIPAFNNSESNIIGQMAKIASESEMRRKIKDRISEDMAKNAMKFLKSQGYKVRRQDDFMIVEDKGGFTTLIVRVMVEEPENGRAY